MDLPNLTKEILAEFITRTESNEVEKASFLRPNDLEFCGRFGISIDNAKANYRELKRNADVHLAVYLKIIESRIRIQSLFDFIDFLDANKSEYITTFLPLVDELLELDIKRNQLNPDKNYKDRQQYNIVQKEIEEKFEPLYKNVTQPILAKLQELGIWGGEKTYVSIYNFNAAAIRNFTENFVSEDIEKIKDYKEKYINFRSETNSDFLSLGFVFEKVDEVLKMLFDFFKDTDINEFESFEARTLEVNSLTEAVKVFNEGKSKHLKVVVRPKSEHSGKSNNTSVPEISLRGFGVSGLRESYEFKMTEAQGGLPIKYKGQSYFVYSIGLGATFQIKELPCYDRKEKKETIVDGGIYIPSFCKGFDEGKEYFKTTFIDNKFQSKETIVSDLHVHYYHVNAGVNGDLKRWKDYVDMTPGILSEDIACKWGYYNGIVHALNEFIKLNPTLFSDFHKCNESYENVEPNIKELLKCVQPVYEHCIESKINEEPNPNYWYDLNQNFAESILTDGLTREFLLSHKDFVSEFSKDIESIGQEIHKVFIAAWKYSIEKDPSKRKSEKTRFNISYSDFEKKAVQLSQTLTYLKNISIDNLIDAERARKFCEYHLQRFKNYFSELGINLALDEKIKDALFFDEVNFLASQSIQTENTDKGKYIPKKTNLPHKYYALAYYLKIMANGRHLPTDSNGILSQTELRQIGKEFLSGHNIDTTGQQFAKSMKDIDLNNITKGRMFPGDWLDKVLPIVKDDETTVDFIKKKYSNTSN